VVSNASQSITRRESKREREKAWGECGRRRGRGNREQGEQEGKSHDREV